MRCTRAAARPRSATLPATRPEPPVNGGRLRGSDAAVAFGGPMIAGDLEEHSFLRAETAWIAAQVAADALDSRHLSTAPRPWPAPSGQACVPIPTTCATSAIGGSSRPRRVENCSQSRLHVYHWHREGFDLPPGAVLLARGGTFENQAFSFGLSHPRRSVSPGDDAGDDGALGHQRKGALLHASRISLRRTSQCGGHCAGVDPYYLAHRAVQRSATTRRSSSPAGVPERCDGRLHRRPDRARLEAPEAREGRCSSSAITFKENVPDVRNAQVPGMVAALVARGIETHVHDPFADADEVRVLHATAFPCCRGSTTTAPTAACSAPWPMPPTARSRPKHSPPCWRRAGWSPTSRTCGGAPCCPPGSGAGPCERKASCPRPASPPGSAPHECVRDAALRAGGLWPHRAGREYTIAVKRIVLVTHSERARPGRSSSARKTCAARARLHDRGLPRCRRRGPAAGGRRPPAGIRRGRGVRRADERGRSRRAFLSAGGNRMDRRAARGGRAAFSASASAPRSWPAPSGPASVPIPTTCARAAISSIYPATAGCSAVPVSRTALHVYHWHREGFDLPPGAVRAGTGRHLREPGLQLAGARRVRRSVARSPGDDAGDDGALGHQRKGPALLHASRRFPPPSASAPTRPATTRRGAQPVAGWLSRRIAPLAGALLTGAWGRSIDGAPPGSCEFKAVCRSTKPKLAPPPDHAHPKSGITRLKAVGPWA